MRDEKIGGYFPRIGFLCYSIDLLTSGKIEFPEIGWNTGGDRGTQSGRVELEETIKVNETLCARTQRGKQMVIASMDAHPCQQLIAAGRFEEEARLL